MARLQITEWAITCRLGHLTSLNLLCDLLCYDILLALILQTLISGQYEGGNELEPALIAQALCHLKTSKAAFIFTLSALIRWS